MVPNGVAQPMEAPSIRLQEHADPTRQTIEPPDLIPHRPLADVLVNGFSFNHVEPGEPRRVGVELRRGAERLINKQLLVRASDARPLSLGWDQSLWSEDNPFGARDNPAVTDLRNPDASASLQALSRHSQTRQSRTAGHGAPSFADGWLDHPAGFDWSFYQTAPPDQQISYLLGNEVVTIEGMHPEARVFSTALAGSNVFAFVANAREDMWEPVAMVADTLQIYPHHMKLVVSWRGRFAVKQPDDLKNLRLLVALADRAEDVELVPVQSLSVESPRRKSVGQCTLDLSRVTLALDSKAVDATATPFKAALAATAAPAIRVAPAIAATPFDVGIGSMPTVVTPKAGVSRTLIGGALLAEALAVATQPNVELHSVAPQPSPPPPIPTAPPNDVVPPLSVPPQKAAAVPSEATPKAPSPPQTTTAAPKDGGTKPSPRRHYSADANQAQSGELAPSQAARSSASRHASPKAPARQPITDVTSKLYGSFD